jgi:hypothetical protein
MSGPVVDRLLDALVDRAAMGPRNVLRLPELGERSTPVVDFLAEAVRTEDVLLHGSNVRTIERFVPREQTSYHGAPVRAVFASADPVWPLFFAVTDTGRAGSRWNACMVPAVTGLPTTRYWFSVGAAPAEVWCDGAVYLLPRDTFVASDEPSEWVSTSEVRPLAVVPVTREDFPFARRVFGHSEGEPGWRLYGRLLRDAVAERRRGHRWGAAAS